MPGPELLSPLTSQCCSQAASSQTAECSQSLCHPASAHAPSAAETFPVPFQALSSKTTSSGQGSHPEDPNSHRPVHPFGALTNGAIYSDCHPIKSVCLPGSQTDLFVSPF